MLFAGTSADSFLCAKGKFIRTTEDYDYWYFYIAPSNNDTLRFIYDSENILKKKMNFKNKIVIVKYKIVEIKDAGSGKQIPEKYLVSFTIDSGKTHRQCK